MHALHTHTRQNVKEKKTEYILVNLLVDGIHALYIFYIRKYVRTWMRAMHVILSTYRKLCVCVRVCEFNSKYR